MHRIRLLIALTSLMTPSPLLAGCGATPGATGAAALPGGDKAIVTLGFGAEGGTQPTIVKRANGEWLVVYVGTNVGDRHLYVRRSNDGHRWSAPAKLASAAYSDQAPALVEDARGVVHCFFASNRSGESFELYHTQMAAAPATFDATGWAEPTRIDGYTGIQDLAVTFADGRFFLAAEVMSEGLFATTSADGTTFSEREQLAMAGFDPAAAFLPDGSAMVAYTRGNELITRLSKPGASWGAEKVVATTASRLRGPALAWAGDHGKLVYTERASTGMTYQLREKRFGNDLSFTNGTVDVLGDASSPTLALDHNGDIGLAWGIKLSSSQQGIAFTLDGWK